MGHLYRGLTQMMPFGLGVRQENFVPAYEARRVHPTALDPTQSKIRIVWGTQIIATPDIPQSGMCVEHAAKSPAPAKPAGTGHPL
jgi:hypothetical protein